MLELPAEGLVTVRDLLARLRQLPGGGRHWRRDAVAVNLQQARPDAVISPSDEVAILPPLAGG
jgi:molybdopterin converting factor small subunit